MQYKGQEILNREALEEEAIIYGELSYVPVKVRKAVMGEKGTFINNAFHESTTLDTKLVDLKDKDGNSLGIQEGDVIRVPWSNDPFVTNENLPRGFEEIAVAYADYTGEWHFGTLRDVFEIYYAPFTVDDKLKITTREAELRELGYESLTADNINKIGFVKTNPDYDPLEPEYGQEYYYNDEEGGNIAAYKAFNSWKPASTKIVEESGGIKVDVTNKRYGKIDNDIYLCRGIDSRDMSDPDDPTADPIYVCTDEWL